MARKNRKISDRAAMELKTATSAAFGGASALPPEAVSAARVIADRVKDTMKLREERATPRLYFCVGEGSVPKDVTLYFDEVADSEAMGLGGCASRVVWEAKRGGVEKSVQERQGDTWSIKSQDTSIPLEPQKLMRDFLEEIKVRLGSEEAGHRFAVKLARYVEKLQQKNQVAVLEQ